MLRTHPTSRFAGVLALSALLFGCRPQPPGPSQLVLLIPGSTAWQPWTGAPVDLPPAYGGRETTLELRLKAEGPTPVSVTQVALEDTSDAAAFSLELTTPLSLAPGETASALLRFHPPYVVGPDTAHAATLHLLGPELDQSVRLRSTARGHDCTLPDTLDFGTCTLGQALERSLELVNDTDEATTTDVEALAAPFSIAGGAGQLTLQAGERRNLTLRYSPSQAAHDAQTLFVTRTLGCPRTAVRLAATSLNGCVSFTARSANDAGASFLDFGFVPPGSTADREIAFLNGCSRQVTLSDLQLTDAAFKLLRPDAGSSLVLPPATQRAVDGGLLASEARVLVRFTPLSLGTRSAQLRAKTELLNQATIAVAMRGTGGHGPRLELTPAPLDFGAVPSIAGAARAVSAELALTAHNTGFPSPSATPLRLTSVSVTAGANSSPTELCVGDFDAVGQRCTNDVGGLPLSSLVIRPGERADLPIQVTPTSTGAKRWTVIVTSNDATQPVQSVDVAATVITPPPCTYAASPEVAFGTLAPPKHATLPVTLHNTGAVPCTFSGFRFTGELGPNLRVALGLDGGTVLTLPPGDKAQLPLTLFPPDTLDGGLIFARLQFNALSASEPIGRVALSAQPEQDCLNLTMDDVDYGAVPLGCASADRAFRVYNRCPLSMLITDAGFTTNEPSGDGGVPFHLAPSSALVGALGPNQAKTFTIRFRPPGPGLHLGAFSLTGLQRGITTTTVGALRGTGSASGEQEDVFVQPKGHVADVLLLIDSSGSPAEEIAGLGQARGAFFEYATQNGVDFHVGVTTVDDDLGGERGQLLEAPSALRYLTGATANFAAQFDALIQVGGNGSATETALSPALRALTPPLTLRWQPNAGFLREESVLGLVVLTDELEQAPLPNAYYVEQLLDLRGPRRANQFSYSVFGPFVAHQPCIFVGDSDDPSTGRHSLAVAAMNGLRENVCDLSGPPAGAVGPVRRIGAQALGRRSRVLLSSRPAPGVTPAVSVDGVSVPAGGPAWSYDAVANAVVFADGYVPEPASTVRIRYATACLP